MKILHYSATYAPAWVWGGPPRSVSILCEGLAAIGDEVTVFTTNAGLEGFADLSLGVEGERNGVRVTYFPSTRSIFGIESRSLELAIHARSQEFDVVHVCGVWQPTAWAAFSATRNSRTPVVVSPRGMLSQYSWNRRALRKYAYWWLRERWMLRKAASFHVAAPSERVDLEKLGLTQRIEVIPNGVDVGYWGGRPTERFRWRSRHGIEPQRVVLLFVGRLHHVKGLDFLLEVLRGWQAIDWHLVLAGPNEDDAGCALATALPSSRLSFLGILDRESLADAYAGSDLLVFPSRRESFGNVAIEGLAAGLSVVMSPQVGASELLLDIPRALIVEREIAAWRQAIQKVALEPVLSDAKDTGFRRILENRFGHVSIARQTRDAYQKLVANINPKFER